MSSLVLADKPLVLYDVNGTAWSPYVENYDVFLVNVSGKPPQWACLCTIYANNVPHLPYLFFMQGSGAKESDWLQWTQGIRLDVALEDFNTVDRANAAAMLDRTAIDGWWYMFYAGNLNHVEYQVRVAPASDHELTSVHS